MIVMRREPNRKWPSSIKTSLEMVAHDERLAVSSNQLNAACQHQALNENARRMAYGIYVCTCVYDRVKRETSKRKKRNKRFRIRRMILKAQSEQL